MGDSVVASVRQQSVPAMTVADRPFIAADVGGTHVRIGLVQASGDPAHPVAVHGYRKYVCADHASLGDILADFVRGLGADTQVERGVVASAGFPLEDGSVITANLPWRISPAQLRDQLGFADLRLVNDFEAVAHAAAFIDASEVLQLTGPDVAPGKGPTLVVGPGTGLGAAVWIPTGRRAVVLATEAGQAALATGTELEMQLVRHMLRQRSHVAVEHALSGPGLLNLYTALCAVRGVAPVHATPGDVTRAAQAGGDPEAHGALDVFCGLLGSVVGDMALLYGVQGGVYLAGGILPQVREFLLASAFVERFLNKGPMREALQQLPVKLVEHGQLGVIGAASWYLDELRGD